MITEGLGIVNAAAAEIGASSGFIKFASISGLPSERVDKFSACDERDEVDDEESVDEDLC